MAYARDTKLILIKMYFTFFGTFSIMKIEAHKVKRIMIQKCMMNVHTTNTHH